MVSPRIRLIAGLIYFPTTSTAPPKKAYLRNARRLASISIISTSSPRIDFFLVERPIADKTLAISFLSESRNTAVPEKTLTRKHPRFHCLETRSLAVFNFVFQSRIVFVFSPSFITGPRRTLATPTKSTGVTSSILLPLWSRLSIPLRLPSYPS